MFDSNLIYLVFGTVLKYCSSFPAQPAYFCGLFQEARKAIFGILDVAPAAVYYSKAEMLHVVQTNCNSKRHGVI